ncbi:Hypothetical_protein [Hexamita inflata]|uniref:Hypothetical_protein n=1 Tax=Hexamita inflata TaxID=28002 RepID=A0AA86VTP5_9EUKA|nr:Hypothetical protein HINF_LOCUS65268 [Hexamita inflata]
MDVDQYVQVDIVDESEQTFLNISSMLSDLIINVTATHRVLSQHFMDNNIKQVCTHPEHPEMLSSPVYNNAKVNLDNIVTLNQVQDNCSTVDITSLLKNTIVDKFPLKSQLVLYESSGNVISYPFTTNKFTNDEYSRRILNFYGLRVKFLYQCKSRFIQSPFDFNFAYDRQQKFYKTPEILSKDSDLTSFIKKLSVYKQKTAVCYDKDGYQSLGDKFWSIINDSQLLDFVAQTYTSEPETIKIQTLFRELNRTISQLHLNEKFRLFWATTPYGSGQDNVATKMQIIIQDTEYLETQDQVLHFLKEYPEITKENQQKHQFEIIIIENTKLKNPISKILQQQLTLSYIKLDIDEYIAHQFQIIEWTESYHMLPRFTDAFGQEVIQICTKINQTAKFNVSVLCQQFPVQQLFTNKGLQFIVNTDIEYIAKNSQIKFNYKYFLAQLQHQWYYHINQYTMSSIAINDSKLLFTDINYENIRFILQTRPIDKYQYKLIAQIQQTTIPFIYSKCITTEQSGYFFTNNQIQVDCTQPHLNTEQIFNNQEQNIESALLLSNNTFSQFCAIKTYLAKSNVSSTIGRMSRNNISLVRSDFILDSTCLQFIQDLIFDCPNREYFTTAKYNYFQRFCHYEENGIQKAQNFTFLVKMHHNMFFTDYLIFPSAKISWMFGSGDFNVVNQEMQTLYPSTDNHLETLVREGVLFCRMHDECDGLVKKLEFGNTSMLKSDTFRQLDNVNGIIFKMIFQPSLTFNCTLQTFNNDLMKDSQMRAQYVQNGFQEISKIQSIVFSKYQYNILLLVLLISTLLFVILAVM